MPRGASTLVIEHSDVDNRSHNAYYTINKIYSFFFIYSITTRESNFQFYKKQQQSYLFVNIKMSVPIKIKSVDVRISNMMI